MRAALLTRYNTPTEITEVPDPECPRDGAVIAVRACGVCRSDHHAWKGADPDVILPHVMGHEFAGEVLEIGPECRAFAVGDRVTEQVIGFTGWGAFAERLAIPRADFNLVRLPDTMGYAAAAGMGCRVTTAFRAVVDRAKTQPGEWLSVHGCGGVGLSAVMIGAAIGARVLAVDVNPEALRIAKTLGANVTLDASQIPDVGAAVRDLTQGGAHVSLDALGITDTFHNSLKSLRKLGRHVQIGMPLGRHATPELPLLELVYSRQITLHGTRGMGADRFDALFAMISAGHLDPDRLITKRIELSGLNDALSAMDGFQGYGVTVVDQLSA